MQIAFYLAVGCLSYSGFGNSNPGNLLTGFGFFNPYWLVSMGNIFVFIHLIGGYQVYLQPVMDFVERQIKGLFPNIPYLYNEYSFNCPGLGPLPVSVLRLVSRSIIVCLTTVIVSAGLLSLPPPLTMCPYISCHCSILPGDKKL